MARPDNLTFETSSLDNGLPVVYCRMQGAVECCGIGVMAGSRDENPGNYGLAHFVEHTIFKGTKRRRSHHVINRMESVGGELNAYTTKEETFVYTLAPAYNLARSVELIADLIVNSTFPSKELDKEREVIIDEINSYLDTPDAAVYDDFEDIIYRDSQLGHNILGSRRSLTRLTSADCQHWLSANYHAGRMVFYYTGPASMIRVMQVASKYLNTLQSTGAPIDRSAPCVVDTFDQSRNIHSHQSHTIMGCRLPVLTGIEADAMSLCNNMLGGNGMNSRFNVSLREQRGLVYTVDSSIARYSDGSLWSVYFGCDKESNTQCRELILSEIERLSDTSLTSGALNMARRQFLGQLTLGRASVDNMALGLGRTILRHNTCRTSTQIKQDFEQLTPTHISQAASRLLTLSTLTFQ